MRILVVGAGALGGYFGGCLVKAGRDVTFLARGQRAAQLAADGLRITGPRGSFTGPVRTVLADSISETFDLVLLAVRAYGLDGATRDTSPRMKWCGAASKRDASFPLLASLLRQRRRPLRHDVADAYLHDGHAVGLWN
jgi:hypothetical protein